MGEATNWYGMYIVYPIQVVLTVDRSNAGFHDKRCCSVSSFNFEVHHTYEYVATGGGMCNVRLVLRVLLFSITREFFNLINKIK